LYHFVKTLVEINILGIFGMHSSNAIDKLKFNKQIQHQIFNLFEKVIAHCAVNITV